MTRHDDGHGPHGARPEGRGAGRSHGGVRSAQLASLVQRIVQGEIQSGIADPRLRGMVTVLGVDPSADMEEATVRVSVLPGEFGPLSVQALNHAAAHMRRAVLKQSRVRQSPRLRFVLDDSLKRAAGLEAAMREAAGDAHEAPSPEAGD
jgi:ribosome-binding factor A